jgi:uncharacterized protein YkwD
MSRARLPKRFALLLSLMIAFGASGVAVTPAPASASGVSCDDVNSITYALWYYNNATRRTYGIPQLGWNNQLACLANDWSHHMASTGVLAHRNLAVTINLPAYRNFKSLGENILKGPRTMSARSMHNAWMASPPHKKNMLSRNFTKVGYGIAYDSKGQIWVTANFGS